MMSRTEIIEELRTFYGKIFNEAADLLEADLVMMNKYSEDEILCKGRPLTIKNMRELIRQHDVAALWAKHKAANTCVTCGGSGDVGTEQDHEPCRACNFTGKYQEPAHRVSK